VIVRNAIAVSEDITAIVNADLFVIMLVVAPDVNLLALLAATWLIRQRIVLVVQRVFSVCAHQSNTAIAVAISTAVYGVTARW
jgi:hypothetical protein